VRFYDAEVGRFTQRDMLLDDSLAAYVYAGARPVVLADPDGRQVVYPTIVASPSCNSEPYAAFAIQQAQSLVNAIVNALSLTRCSPTLTVYCYNKTRACLRIGTYRECRKAFPGSNHMHINFAPFCPDAKCLILHELIHACGLTGHAGHRRLKVPGCRGTADFG
jgi:hypothetical protein